MSFPLSTAAPVEWPVAEGGNGHYYEAVADEDFLVFADTCDGAWNDVPISNSIEGYIVEYDQELSVPTGPSTWSAVKALYR